LRGTTFSSIIFFFFTLRTGLRVSSEICCVDIEIRVAYIDRINFTDAVKIISRQPRYVEKCNDAKITDEPIHYQSTSR